MKIIKVCRISREIIQKGDVFIVFLRSYRDTFLICSVLLLFCVKDIKNLISIPEYGMEPKKLRRAQELKRLSPSIFFSPSSLSGEVKQKWIPDLIATKSMQKGKRK